MKKRAVKRLPINRPCMSTAQASTVSISPAAAARFNSSKVRLPAILGPVAMNAIGIV